MFLSHRRNHLRLMRMSICMYIYVITVCMYQTTSTISARPYKFIYMYICMHELGSANIVKIHSKRQYYCLYNTYILQLLSRGLVQFLYVYMYAVIFQILVMFRCLYLIGQSHGTLLGCRWRPHEGCRDPPRLGGRHRGWFRGGSLPLYIYMCMYVYLWTQHGMVKCNCFFYDRLHSLP